MKSDSSTNIYFRKFKSHIHCSDWLKPRGLLMDTLLSCTKVSRIGLHPWLTCSSLYGHTIQTSSSWLGSNRMDDCGLWFKILQSPLQVPPALKRLLVVMTPQSSYWIAFTLLLSLLSLQDLWISQDCLSLAHSPSILTVPSTSLCASWICFLYAHNVFLPDFVPLYESLHISSSASTELCTHPPSAFAK